MSSLPSCSSSDTADVAQDMIASDVDSLITQDDIPVETQAKDQPKVQFLVALNLIERIVLNLIKAGLLDIDHVKEVYAGIDEYCSDYEILPPEP
ncbi:hypothetical protein FCULG_00006343 [Fusarium culmorum]|uniref:Uncharacterized protein n=1 Tax=Fusarium culmorum TaxID=5516 RepID=A0A2T4GUW3_FUSCU|nr:hypothetical protein FCULG_00006343 [Fusarium culmorum]